MPGMLLTFGLLFIFRDYSYLDKLINILKSIKIIYAIALTICFFALLYFVGQFIGCISHLLYDRLFVHNLIGYPLQSIVKAKGKPADSVRATYLAISASIFSFVAFPVLFKFLSEYIIGNFWSKLIMFILFGILLVLTIVLIYLRTKIIFKQNTEQCSTTTSDISQCSSKSGAKLFSFMAKATSYLTFPFTKITATDSKIDPAVISAFYDRMNKKFKIDLNVSESYNSDTYWLAYIYVIKKNQTHATKLNTWLNLYGCLRNYSCAFFIMACAIAFRQWGTIFDGVELALLPYTHTILLVLFLSLILFMRYWIIYYGYYTKYIVRSFAYDL